MKTLIFVAILLFMSSLIVKAQIQVLKVDSLQRQKIESFTLAKTFPNIIVFLKDKNNEYIVGTEVLADPAYDVIDVFQDSKLQSLKKLYYREIYFGDLPAKAVSRYNKGPCNND